jgi:hypothetical protein
METDIQTRILQELMDLFGLLMIMPTFGLVMSLNGSMLMAILLETIHLVLMEIYAQEWREVPTMIATVVPILMEMVILTRTLQELMGLFGLLLMGLMHFQVMPACGLMLMAME